jgi:hypothetical protein
MSAPRPRVVEPEGDTTTAEFDVDSHGAESLHPEPAAAAQTPDEPTDVAPVIVVGWTPEEATQLICALWNFGMIIYGPEWAAHPAETQGWNISAAQLLDQFLPKGVGGFVELGAGLIMVGNGLAMMGLRRIPIIKAGPKPMWVRRPASDVEAEVAPAPPAAPSPNGGGKYRMPADLAPKADDSLSGLGL